MFTIKHIQPNGNETLIECGSFERTRRDDGFWQYSAYPEGNQCSDYLATWCGDEQPALGILTCHNLFVMNRFGSTVSKHSFCAPDFMAGNVECEPSAPLGGNFAG